MQKNKYLALSALGFFLTGCAGLTKNQAALVGATLCGVGGAAGGAVAANNRIEGSKRNTGAAVAIGAVSGAVLCGGLAYLLTEDPKMAPKPATPPPPPPPPPPAKKPEAKKPEAKPEAKKPEAKPEAKKPAPKVERTIILDDVLFDFDKSNVKPEAAAILDRLVAFMNENKDKNANLSGHTDNVGSDAYNQALSERRVSSVKDYVSRKGVAGSRVSGQGFGESKPIADNKTAEGRAKNRRVEIKVN